MVRRLSVFPDEAGEFDHGFAVLVVRIGECAHSREAHSLRPRQLDGRRNRGWCPIPLDDCHTSSSHVPPEDAPPLDAPVVDVLDGPQESHEFPEPYPVRAVVFGDDVREPVRNVQNLGLLGYRMLQLCIVRPLEAGYALELGGTQEGHKIVPGCVWKGLVERVAVDCPSGPWAAGWWLPFAAGPVPCAVGEAARPWLRDQDLRRAPCSPQAWWTAPSTCRSNAELVPRPAPSVKRARKPRGASDARPTLRTVDFGPRFGSLRRRAFRSKPAAIAGHLHAKLTRDLPSGALETIT